MNRAFHSDEGSCKEIKRESERPMELIRIVGMPHLSNRCPRALRIYTLSAILRITGFGRPAVDGAVDARGGVNLIAVLHAPSISCIYCAGRCLGSITRKYMIPTEARGIKKPPNSSPGMPALQ